MIDPTQKRTKDDPDAGEDKPELESETLTDLTPPEGQGEGVKGGVTTGAGEPACKYGTW